MKKFIKICKKDQKELKTYLTDVLVSARYKPVSKDGFLYAKGNIPVLLTAHMDTVHKEKCRDVVIENKNGKTVISSPQGIGGDDRCGVYIITKIITKTNLRPYILFCEDEEIGRVGASKFCRTNYIKDLDEVKFMIELDRMNANDAVFYDCDNPDFTEFILDNTNYIEDWGSFSDISELMPESEAAGVNLSCGYYNPHTTDEYVVFEEMLHTMEVTKLLIELANEDTIPTYNFIEARYNFRDGWYESWGNAWGYNEKEKTYYFDYFDAKYNDVLEEFVEAKNIDEAVGKLLRMYPYVTYNDIVNYYT